MNKTDELAELIERELTEFSEEKEAELAEEIDRIADILVEELKSHPALSQLKGRGKYKKGFYRKTVAEGKGYKRSVVANKKYQLTHLLERGHLTRNGVTRTRAYPHWADAQARLEELTEGVLE